MKYLALAYSTVAVLIFLYGGYLVALTPDVFFAYQVIGGILLVPAVAWWLVGLVLLAMQRRWGWFVGYLLLLMLAPMIYDMYRVRVAESYLSDKNSVSPT